MILSLTKIISFLVDRLIIIIVLFLSSARSFAIPTIIVIQKIILFAAIETTLLLVIYTMIIIYTMITYNEKLVTDSSSVVTVGRKKGLRIIPRFTGCKGCIPSAFRFLDLLAGKKAGSGFDKG